MEIRITPILDIAIEWNTNVRAMADLRRRIAPFVLRQLKNDPAVAVELPDKQEMTALCSLMLEQAGLYSAVMADLLKRMEHMHARGAA